MLAGQRRRGASAVCAPWVLLPSFMPREKAHGRRGRRGDPWLPYNGHVLAYITVGAPLSTLTRNYGDAFFEALTQRGRAPDAFDRRAGRSETLLMLYAAT
jgi:hypothetical protein